MFFWFTPFSQIHVMPLLRYGMESSVDLELSGSSDMIECGIPSAPPLVNPLEAATAALANPLEYPPFSQTATPGDRVVIALGQGVPRAADIVAAVVQGLLAAGVGADGISLLRGSAAVDPAAIDPCRLVDRSAAERIRIVAHDPNDRSQLAYLAASDAGEPIMLHRALTDADVIVPIGCRQNGLTAGYFGIHSSLYPTFSDPKTQARFRRADCLAVHADRHKQLNKEVEQVAWLLGVNFSIQVVPAGEEEILHVVAGQSDAVRRQSRRLYQAAWRTPVPHRASLVVAAIPGGPSQQTWENFGRALETAAAVVETDGVIAVCSELATPPGPAVQRLTAAESRHAALRENRHDAPADAVPAAQLAHAQDQARVYLLSRLDPALVESLDMVAITDANDIARLTQRHPSSILLSNAPYALVSVQDEYE